MTPELYRVVGVFVVLIILVAIVAADIGGRS